MTKMPLMTFIVILMLCLSTKISAQKVIQEKRSLTANSVDDGKGVVSATAYIDYLVRRVDDEVVFNLSYSDVNIYADAGYYYKGKKYGREVPGLIEELKKTGGSFPRVNFDVYFGAVKMFSFKHAISAHNTLSAYGGDIRMFKTTKDKLDNPNWSLVANGLESFNYSPNSTIWMNIEELINKYERSIKEKEEYNGMIEEADRLQNSNKLNDALAIYLKASKHPLTNKYPSEQVEKIKSQLSNNEKEETYRNYIKQGESAEREKDYTSALSYYTAASKTGFNNSTADSYIRRVQNAINNLKKQQEEEIAKKQQEQNDKETALKKNLQKEQDEANKILEEKDRELEQKNIAELEKIKKDLEEEDRKKVEEKQQERYKQEADDRRRREQEKKERVQKEQDERREADASLIESFEEDMYYDPILYEKYKMMGDEAEDKAWAINPYSALELDKKWWDMNIHMEAFKDELNEPRRQEAFGKSLSLMHKMEAQLEWAKDYYMRAIKYTDRDSEQHKYLLRRIESMNKMVDFQKAMIEGSRQGEEQRQVNYQRAKEFKVAQKLSNNRAKAVLLYSNTTFGSKYPDWSGNIQVDNAVQNQLDFERRLNEADQQLLVNQAITGVTSQIAVGAMVDDSKTTQLYRKNDVGINIYSFTGYAGYPIVSNDTRKDGYIPETFNDQLNVAPFQGGFDLWLHRGKIWDFAINGDIIFGVLPFAGYQNNFFSYGGNVKVNVGYKRLKLAFEADHHNRSGNYEYDQDVAQASDPNNISIFQQPTNRILTGNFNYSVLKVGGGLHISVADESDDGYIRLLMYAEKPSFMTDYNIIKPILSLGTQVVFRGGITVGFDYSQNYPSAGKAENILSTYDSQAFWKLSFGKTWTLAKSK